MSFDENNPLDENGTSQEIPVQEPVTQENPIEEAPAVQEEALTPKEEAPTPQENTQYHYAYKPAKKKKKGWTAGKVIALALVCCLIGSMLGVGGTVLGYRFLPYLGVDVPNGSTSINVGKREPVKLEINEVDTGKQMTPAQIYAANVNATVGINTSVTTKNYWGYPTTAAVSGSGFVLTPDGYVATNYHVVKGANDIKVTMFDGTTYSAILLGYNESKDVAVLKMEATGLQAVVLGDSDKMNVGEEIMAIGNPLGELTFSLSTGVVSALNREVTFSDSGTMELIQTDCAINSGNSGGAMFNSYGEVVGIATGKYSGTTGGGSYIDNIGFAVPINDIKNIVEQVITKGYVAKAYLGVTFTNVKQEAILYGIPKGAGITAVDKDSPAQQAGIQVKDIITHVGETVVEDMNGLAKAVDDCKPGDTVELTIYRMGQTIKVQVTFGEKILPTEY